MNVFGRYVSKKLTIVLIAILVLVLDSQGLLGLDPQDAVTLRWVVVSYVIGQSMVDSYSGATGGKPAKEPPSPPTPIEPPAALLSAPKNPNPPTPGIPDVD